MWLMHGQGWSFLALVQAPTTPDMSSSGRCITMFQGRHSIVKGGRKLYDIRSRFTSTPGATRSCTEGWVILPTLSPKKVTHVPTLITREESLQAPVTVQDLFLITFASDSRSSIHRSLAFFKPPVTVVEREH